MKKVKTLLLLSGLTLLLVGCINKDSHNVTTVNNTTNNNGPGSNGNNPNNNGTTPLTLVNVKIGQVVFYAGDTNRHWTIPVQNRSVRRTPWTSQLAVTLETSQSVNYSIVAELRDFAYNQTLISNASVSNGYGTNSTAIFSPTPQKGTYILTLTVTLIDPVADPQTGIHRSKMYEYIYPLCIE